MFTDPPRLAERIARRIEETRISDAMCGIQLDAPCARSLGELTDHPAILRELRSVGAPESILAATTPENSVAVVRQRSPYLRKIRNTSSFWRLQRVLNDLFDYTTPEILEADIESIDARIAAASVDPQWASQILADRCRIDRLVCDHAMASMGLNPSSAEDALGVRVNYFWDASALLKFAHPSQAADHRVTRPPWSERFETIFGIRPSSLQALHRAVGDFLDATINGQVKFLTARLSSRIRLDQPDQAAIDHLLERELGGVPLTDDETDMIVSATGAAILSWADQNRRAVVLQGLGRSPHQPYSCPAAIARLAKHYATVRFVLADYARDFARHAHHLAASQPNIALAGHFDSTFVSSLIAEESLERLQVVPIGKSIGFASLAPTVEWVYANLQATRYGVALGFARAIESDHLHESRVPELLADLLENSAIETLGL